MNIMMRAINNATTLAIYCIPLFIIIAMIAGICFFAYNIYRETQESKKLDEIYMNVIEKKYKEYKEKTTEKSDQTNQEQRP